MKNYLFVFLFLMFILPLVSAENIGTYKVNQPMEITNYCQAGNCSYVTLISLEYPNGTITYPNTNMTNNSAKSFNYSFTPDTIGEYTFVTCGDSLIVVCDSDSFDVTYTGRQCDTFRGRKRNLLEMKEIFQDMLNNKISDDSELKEGESNE